MSVQDDLKQELRRIAIAGCSPSNPQVAVVNAAGSSVEVRLSGIDTIGCSFTSFVCRIDRLASATIDELKRTSEQLASRLNYLLEPIRPIEVDHDQCVVQLRSQPPLVGDDGSTYYELLARRGELSLVRWRQPRGGERTAVPADVTREVLSRLAADFAAFA